MLYPEAIMNSDNDINSRYDYGRSEIFKQAFNYSEKNNNSIDKQYIIWEIWAFDLRLKSYNDDRESEFKSQAFGSYWGVQNLEGKWSYYPDLKQFTDETYQYYKNRMISTTNPINRARYSDILWDQRHDYEAAKVAVSSYIETAFIWLKLLKEKPDEYILNITDSFCRAIKISISLSDHNLVNEVFTKSLSLINEFVRLDKPRYLIDIIETFLDASNINRIVDVTQLQKAIEFGIERFTEINDLHIVRHFLKIEKKFYKIIGTIGKEKEIDELSAQSYIKEAEDRLVEGPMKSYSAASHFYEKALDIYIQLGKTKTVEKLKVKIKECYDMALKSEYQEFKTTIEIKHELINYYLKNIESLSNVEKLRYIAQDSEIKPSYAKAKEMADDDRKKYPLTNMIDNVIIRNSNPVSVVKGSIDSGKMQEIRNFVFDYKYLSIFLTSLFDKMKEKGDFDTRVLLDLFKDSYFLKDDLHLLEYAIDKYFAKDYVAFIYVMTFRLEGIFRRFLKVLDKATTTKNKTGIQEQTFDSVVNNQALKDLFGSDFIEFVRYFLLLPEGTNLRHDLAHSLVDDADFNEINANLLLYIYLNISNYLVKRREKEL